jgi:hypothetical protein
VRELAARGDPLSLDLGSLPESGTARETTLTALGAGPVHEARNRPRLESRRRSRIVRSGAGTVRREERTPGLVGSVGTSHAERREKSQGSENKRKEA